MLKYVNDMCFYFIVFILILYGLDKEEVVSLINSWLWSFYVKYVLFKEFVL